MKQLLKQIQLPKITNADTQASRELFTENYDFIQHYTQREFTVTTDKLPALSGIVQSFHEHLNPPGTFRESYLAGLWREDLLTGLLWEVRPIDETGRFRNPDIRPKGPSWTWSSVDEEVVYMDSRTPGEYIPKYSARVIEADVVLAGTNPAGAVKSGRLVLRGALKKAFEEEDQLEKIALMMGAKMDLPIDDALEIEEMWLLRIFAWKDEIAKKEDSSDSSSEGDREESYVNNKNRWGEPGISETVRIDDHDDVDDALSNPKEDNIRSDAEDNLETDEWATALILAPTGESPQEYRRIGLISMWPNSGFSDIENSEVVII